jgi:hypothetical protein
LNSEISPRIGCAESWCALRLKPLVRYASLAMARGILDGTFQNLEHGHTSIIGPQPTASSYRMYNAQAKNACRNAFRTNVRET